MGKQQKTRPGTALGVQYNANQLRAIGAEAHKTVLRPAVKRVRFPVQMELFEYKSSAPKVVMGYYYELLTAALWGGEVQGNIYMKLDDGSWGKPDVVNGTGYGESKACRLGGHLNLNDNQMEKYEIMQLEDTLPKITLTLYRHNLKNISKFAGSDLKLYEALCAATVFAIRLPFSIILLLWGMAERGNDFTRRYTKPETYGKVTCVRSSTLNSLFATPEAMLQALGLHPEQFIVKRTKTPTNYMFLDYKVQSFPIVVIKHKDHAAWLASYRKEEAQRIPF